MRSSNNRGTGAGEVRRWTAQRKVAIILEILKGQISVPEPRAGIASLEVSPVSGRMTPCAVGSVRPKSIAKGSMPNIAQRFAASG